MTTASSSLAGRAIGAMFFSIFGGVWLAFWSVRVFGSRAEIFAVVALVTVVLFVVAYRQFRANREAYAQESKSPAREKVDRIFNIVNAVQWILIFIVANVLNNFGHSEWVLASVIFIVGAHFIPLAYAFRVPSHYVTGTVMMLLAISYPFLAEGGAANPVGCLGAGLALWGSAAYALLPKSLTALAD